MDDRYDDDEDTYNKKTREILEDIRADRWKEYRDNSDQTLLHYAARSGDRGIFAPEPSFGSHQGGEYNSRWEDLLQKFTNDPDAIKSRDMKGRSALSWAAETENIVAIRMLLRPPSTVGNISKTRMPNVQRSLYHDGQEIYKNDLDSNGRMPLFHLLCRRTRDPQNCHESSRKGNLSVPGRKDPLGPMKNLIWNWDKWGNKRNSPFSTDARESCQGLSWQPDYFDKDYLNGKGQDGRSLLSHAVERGDFNFVHTLLEVEGINVKLADDDGTSPLMQAIQKRNDRIAILLSSRDSCLLQDLPHILICPNDNSVIERLNWAFQKGIINNKTRGEAMLQHALNLKHLTAVKAALKHGVSPRKAFKYRSDWFELMNNSATQPKHLIVAETEMQGRKEYSLDFPDDDPPTNYHRLLHIYRDFEHFDSMAYSKNQYASHRVILEANNQELTSNINLTFPDPEEFFITEIRSWLCRDQVRDKKSESKKGIRWTRFGKGQASYHTILSSGEIPEDGNRFISDLVADLQVEWDRIFDTAEDRFNKSFIKENMERRLLLKYLAAEGKYLATLRHALYQHTKSTSDLVKDYNDKIRSINDISERFPFEESHRECVEKDFQHFEKGTNVRLQQQEQALRDARQMELAHISLEETIFLKRLSLITFIYLPLMLTASLFGMNVNALQSNPDWRWFVLFGLGSLALTYGLWKISEGDFEKYTLRNIVGRLRGQRSAQNDDKS